MLGTGRAGVLALAAFALVERRRRHRSCPAICSPTAQFTAANVVTLLVYAALGLLFVLLVLQLQVVVGFSPLVAGTALLPVTVLMLLLSARAGALGARIGPRFPMTVGLAGRRRRESGWPRIGRGRVVLRRRTARRRRVRAGARARRSPR